MKRTYIYVVIEFNANNAIAQGAFNTEAEAYEAMHAWMGPYGQSSSANWTVKPCTLNN